MQNTLSFDLAVVGAGASGMTAAIIAKRENPALRVALLEANSRVGKKLLTTGNGQCNLSNSDVLDSHYHGSSVFALNVLKNAQQRVKEWFESLSVELVTDERGRIYPYSRQASAVLDALRFELERLSIEVICDCKVLDIKKQKEEFFISSSIGAFRVKRVIVATGSNASASGAQTGYGIAKNMGHKITPLTPAIVQLKTETEKIRALKGVKTEASVSLIKNGKIAVKYTDEILFTDYGISGPAPMFISRDAVQGDEIKIDFCPDIPYFTLCEKLFERRTRCSERPVIEFLNGFLNKRLGMTLCKGLGDEKVSDLSDAQIKALAKSVKEYAVRVTGNKGFSSAQVTAGGVDTADINEFFESKKVSGLYFIGEILNVDGDCGGYNLLFAWISGMTAGKNASE